MRLIVQQTGTVGKFDFQTMLINISASFGLLALSSFIVEMLMLKALPQKKLYNSYKFTDTIDFSDWRDLNPAQQGAYLFELDRISNMLGSASSAPGSGDSGDGASGESMYQPPVNPWAEVAQGMQAPTSNSSATDLPPHSSGIPQGNANPVAVGDQL